MARELEPLGHAVIVADTNYAQMYANRSRRSKTDNGAELLRPDGEALGVAARTAVFTGCAHRVPVLGAGRRWPDPAVVRRRACCTADRLDQPQAR